MVDMKSLDLEESGMGALVMLFKYFASKTI